MSKIKKDIRKDNLSFEDIGDEEIEEFRKYFYRHPEVQEDMFKVIEEDNELKRFNEFMKYAIEYKILKDEDLVGVREVRQFLYMSNTSVQNT